MLSNLKVGFKVFCVFYFASLHCSSTVCIWALLWYQDTSGPGTEEKQEEISELVQDLFLGRVLRWNVEPCNIIGMVWLHK